MKRAFALMALATVAGCGVSQDVYQPPPEVVAGYQERMAQMRQERPELFAAPAPRPAANEAAAFPPGTIMTANGPRVPLGWNKRNKAEPMSAAEQDKQEWRQAAQDACGNQADFHAYGSGLAYPLVYQREVARCIERWERTGYVNGFRFRSY